MAGLYIHIPYCRSKCAYCDFFSMPPRAGNREAQYAAYVDALIAEFNLRRSEIAEPFITIYFGGGTPSMLPANELLRLITALPTADVTEFTIEANPEDITPEFLKLLAATPVNRLSIGIQSFNRQELTAVGRQHSVEQCRRAIATLSGNRFANYSLDLIYGLPGQTLESWAASLDELLAARPPHFSAYMLQWEEGTRLNAMRANGKLTPADDSLLLDMYGHLCRRAAQEGYRHYEISNFALPGMESKHNSSYWDFTPYLGLGASAHSFDGHCRRMNPLSVKRYLAGEAPEVEEENPAELHNETLLTALRRDEGIDLAAFTARFGTKATERILTLSHPYISHGHMYHSGNRLGITEEGWMLTDSILVTLFE